MLQWAKRPKKWLRKNFDCLCVCEFTAVSQQSKIIIRLFSLDFFHLKIEFCPSFLLGDGTLFVVTISNKILFHESPMAFLNATDYWKVVKSWSHITTDHRIATSENVWFTSISTVPWEEIFATELNEQIAKYCDSQIIAIIELHTMYTITGPAKDQIPLPLRSNIVYRNPCKDCHGT